MWRGIVASLTAVYIMIGQAWAVPVDVSVSDTLTCPGGCQVGSLLLKSRDVLGAPSNPDGAAFQDVYSFTTIGAATIVGQLSNSDASPFLNVEGLTIQLLDAGMASLGLFAVPDGDGTNFLTPLSFPNLAAGAYSFVISGVIPTGVAAGQYQLQAQLIEAAVSQVPLPPAILLFLSALVGMFSLTQMRKRSV